MDKIDKYFIYALNDKRLNGKPTFVFKTSSGMIQIATQMDASGDSYLAEQFCFLDGQHRRVKGFVTLGLHVYHPLLCRIIKLATIEVEKECAEAVEIFFNLWNEVLQKEKNDPQYVFNPAGFSIDEASALRQGLIAVYGEQVVSKIVSCRFHFSQSANIHVVQ